MEIKPPIRYLEIVTPDVEGTLSVLENSSGVTFSNPVAELGNARVADIPGGGQISVRAPMHETEVILVESHGT